MKINSKYLRGEYINNNSSKLIIIATGAGSKDAVEEDLHLLKSDCQQLYNRGKNNLENILENYNYFKLSDNKSHDYLYLKDFYHDFYGYFFLNKDEYILEEVCSELDAFIREKGYQADNVLIFGSSKGGYAAMLLGNMTEMINNTFSCIPALHLSYYQNVKTDDILLEKINDVLYGNEIRKSHTEKVIKLISDYALTPNPNKKQTYLLGRNDTIFFNPAFEILNQKNNFDILIEEGISGHRWVILGLIDKIYDILYNFSTFDYSTLDLTHYKNQKMLKQGKKTLEYQYINNKSDKIIIIPEDLRFASKQIEIIEKYGIDSAENTQFINGKNYKSQYKELLSNQEYNYLIIKDNHNGLLGYNFIENESYILPKLVAEMDSFIRSQNIKRKNILIAGIAKSAYIARLIAQQSVYTNNVICIEPQLRMMKYQQENSLAVELNGIFYGNETKREITSNLEALYFKKSDMNEMYICRNRKKIPSIRALDIEKKTVYINENPNITREMLLVWAIDKHFNFEQVLV